MPLRSGCAERYVVSYSSETFLRSDRSGRGRFRNGREEADHVFEPELFGELGVDGSGIGTGVDLGLNRDLFPVLADEPHFFDAADDAAAGNLLDFFLDFAAEEVASEAHSAFYRLDVDATHPVEPFFESGEVGELDGEAGSGIEFENHRSLITVDGDVGTEKAERGNRLGLDGHGENLFPVGDLDTGERETGSGNRFDDLSLTHDSGGSGSGREVDTDPDRSLLKVRFAVGSAGRETEHRHDRDAVEDDDADIRDTLVAVGLEKLEEFETLFEEGDVGSIGK